MRVIIATNNSSSQIQLGECLSVRRESTAALKAEDWLYRCGVGLVLAWALTSITYPFGWDHGIFAWVGDVINRGGMPYRDAWDIKGPVAYYLYAFVEWLCGRNQWGIRVLDLILLLSATIVLTRFASFLTNPRVGRWAAVLFPLWYASGSYWHTAQPDGWVAMFMTLGLLPIAMEQQRTSLPRLAVAGFLVGCSTLIKPFYVAFLIALLTFVITAAWRRSHQLPVVLTTILAGFSAPLVITAIWFIHRQAWSDLLRIYLLYPATVYASANSGVGLSRIQGVLEYVLTGRVVVVLLPAAGVGLIALWRQRRPIALLLIIWTSIAVLMVALQDRFFAYHWVPIFPPLALCAIVGFGAALGRTAGVGQEKVVESSRITRSFIYVVFSVVLFHAAIHPLFEVAHALRFVSGFTTSEQYYNQFGIPGRDIEVANYVREKTRDQDRIFVWGWNASIVYLSGRQIPSRFGFIMPLLQAKGSPWSIGYQEEFMAAIKKDPPIYIIEDPRSASLLEARYARSRFAEFDNFVATRYQREKQIGDLILYRLNDPSFVP